MNLKRKCEIQEKRISSLLSQNERLRVQNEKLKRENDVLSDEIELYKYQFASMEEIKKTYFDGLQQIRIIKDEYARALNETRILKNEYSKKFKQLIKQIK